MDIQGISTAQILTVGIFLVGLIFLQVFITKNKTKFWSWNLFQYSKHNQHHNSCYFDFGQLMMAHHLTNRRKVAIFRASQKSFQYSSNVYIFFAHNLNFNSANETTPPSQTSPDCEVDPRRCP